MPKALLELLLLQGKAFARRVLRGALTLRGAAFFAVGLLMFGLWAWSLTLSVRADRPSPDAVRSVVPLMLLGVCLLSALTSTSDRAIAFTPGEVDFLFPGPFTRRQLIVYKLTKSTLGAALSAAVISLALMRYASLWLACYAGALLSLLLVQFLSTVLVLAGQTVSERAWSRGRRVVVGVVLVAAALGAREALGRHSLSDAGRIDPAAAVQQFGRSQAGRVLLAPFDVFGRTFTAERAPDLLAWGSLALGINLALLGLIVRLDRNYLQAAVGASQRRYERVQRLRGGGLMSATAKGNVRRRLPTPPFLGGVGPIAWRQLANARRSAGGLLVVLLALALTAGPFFVASRRDAAGPDDPSPAFAGLLSSMLGVSVMLASLLRFDFRADLDAMDTVKALPLRPWAVAAGQLVAPTVVMTAIHWLLLAAVAVTFGTRTDGGHFAGRDTLAIAAILALPFNALLFAAENLVFLFSPSRPTAVGPGDFQILGRQIVALALRTALVMFGAAMAAGAAAVVYFLADRSLVALTAAAAATLVAETAALVPVVGWAFRRFDPSVHTPA